MTIRNLPSVSRLAAGSALGLVLAATATPAFAQDNDGEYWVSLKNRIVVTATRTAVKAEDIPVTVTVKSDEQIADELVTDIRDLVRFEPGVSVQRQPARFGAALGATGRAGNGSFNNPGIGGNRGVVTRPSACATWRRSPADESCVSEARRFNVSSARSTSAP